jgi:hypothetical protein
MRQPACAKGLRRDKTAKPGRKELKDIPLITPYFL